MRLEAIPGPLNMMMERAAMREVDIYNRTRDIFHYFKLPYDAAAGGARAAMT